MGTAGLLCGSPKPPLHQAEQAQFPQPLPMGAHLQLDDVPPVLGSPALHPVSGCGLRGAECLPHSAAFDSHNPRMPRATRARCCPMPSLLSLLPTPDTGPGIVLIEFHRVPIGPLLQPVQVPLEQKPLSTYTVLLDLMSPTNLAWLPSPLCH